MSVRIAPVIAVLLVAAGCGSDSDDSRERPVTPATYTPETRGRDVVATVNGEPVYSDCVVAQARAKGLEPREALDECIAFELLAAAARERQLLSDREVIETSKREAVRQFLAAEFYSHYSGPESLPVETMRQFWTRMPRSKVALRDYFDHPELRDSAYCRVPVAKPGKDQPTPPGVAPTARSVASIIEASMILREESGQFDVDAFLDVCRSIGQGVTIAGSVLEAVRFSPRPKSGLERGFGGALFTLPGPGTRSGVIRSESGWFLIYLVSVRSERHLTFEQALPQLRELVWRGDEALKSTPWAYELELYRRELFLNWAKQYEANYAIEQYPERIPEGTVTAAAEL